MGKTNPRGTAPTRHDRLLREHQHDTYHSRAKIAEPAACKDCGAVLHKGRWQWGEAPANAHLVLCPACQRIHDRYPGGYLTLSGPFFDEHREEILHLARNTEEREKTSHPLRRIMAIEDQPDGSVLVTTTAMEVARAVGDAVHRAYKGELDYQYAEESSLLRVNWHR